MLRLWPLPGSEDTEPADMAQTLAELERPAFDDRPWVMTNMVTSVDGAASRAGRSGGLGGAGDRQMFSVVRRLPDAVLVGAGTVRAERYRPIRTPGRTGPPPRLVIATARLDLDPSIPALADADDEHRALVVTVAGADPERRRQLEPLADVVDAGEGSIDPERLLGVLADHGHQVVLCEGGPTLLGQLLARDLVDEWFVTVAGRIIGGDAGRIVRTPEETDRRLRLRSAFTDETDVFVSYVRDHQDD